MSERTTGTTPTASPADTPLSQHPYHPNLFGDDGSCNHVQFGFDGLPERDCGLPADHPVHQPATSSGQTAEHGIDTAAIRAVCDDGHGFNYRQTIRVLCDALDRQGEETARLRAEVEYLRDEHDPDRTTQYASAMEDRAENAEQQRDDARARLDEIDAVVPPCSDPNCGCVANRVRAILDR